MIKCRGPTRCAYINKLEEKLEIHINERNQPIGPNSMKLAWLLGALAREMVPMTFFLLVEDSKSAKGELVEYHQCEY